MRDEAPETGKAFDDLIRAAFYNSSLDEKTRQLIHIGIRASQGDAIAVSAHAPLAKKAGATRAEVRDAVLMTTFMCGTIGLINCLVPALEGI
jgi:AhpD family alkylhydroperoxidase